MEAREQRTKREFSLVPLRGPANADGTEKVGETARRP